MTDQTEPTAEEVALADKILCESDGTIERDNVRKAAILIHEHVLTRRASDRAEIEEGLRPSIGLLQDQLAEAERLLRAVLDEVDAHAHLHLGDDYDPDCPSCDAERWLASKS